jgi:hypothetical protein
MRFRLPRAPERLLHERRCPSDCNLSCSVAGGVPIAFAAARPAALPTAPHKLVSPACCPSCNRRKVSGSAGHRLRPQQNGSRASGEDGSLHRHLKKLARDPQIDWLHPLRTCRIMATMPSLTFAVQNKAVRWGSSKECSHCI